jgi:hypothetical protein
MTDNRNEVTVDFTSDERHKVNPAVMKNGAGVGLALEQAFAQS